MPRPDEAALGKQEPTAVEQDGYPTSISRLLEATRVVPWEADAETWKFTYVGPQAANLLGYPVQAWYEKDFWVSHLHPDDRDAALDFCVRSSGKCRDYEFEYRMVSAGGESVWIHDLVSVEAEQGVPKILRGFLIDITDRKQIEDERRTAEVDSVRHREELAHATRVSALGELQAALAHELNQPLAAILSNAQAATRFLDQDPLDVDELRAILTDIIADDRRASDTISHVRAMMKHDQVRRELVDVNAQIGLAVDMVRSELLIKNVTVWLELDPTTPRISGDPIQIQQVVLNLIMNGVDAVAGREREARNVTLSSQSDGSNVMVSVRDSGRGIVETALPRLFDSFYTTKPDGLGMGLSICRSLVEAHGGRVWVADTSSTGTTLRFTLPIGEGGQP